MNWFPIHLHTLPRALLTSELSGVVVSVEINTTQLLRCYNPSEQWMQKWPKSAIERITYFIQHWNEICPQQLSNKRIFFSIENLPQDEILDAFQLRSIGLSVLQIFHHQAPNRYISPIAGLSKLGHALLQSLEKNKIFLDLSHLSGDLLSHVLSHAHGPKIVSHVVCADLLQPAITARANAMTPEELLACDAKLYGVPFIDDLLCPIGTSDPMARKTDVMRLSQHIKRMAEVVGIDRVALGPDFFSEADYKILGVSIIPSLDTPSGLSLLRQCLLHDGFTESDAKAVFSENALRVMEGF